MTEAEKLLQETKSAAVVAESQAEDICVIDSDLRIIGIPEQFKVLGVEYDKDVKVIQFRIPKVYKGTDLSAFTISVNYQNARGTKDRYVVTDKKVSGDQIEFSWTVGKTAIEYRGDTRFIVCMRLTGSDGIIQKEFNTTLATMTVLEGLEVDNPVIEQEEKDIIAQLLQIVDDKSKEVVQAVTAEGTKQIKAVQDAAQEVIADREQIKTNKADIADLRQMKAGAIINSAKGERIAVGDSADAFFEGLKLFGKSEQVQTKGYQLFDASKIPTKSAGGATVTNNGDGSFTISGSGNLTEYFGANYQITDKEVIKNLFKTGKLYLKNSNTFPYFLIYFVDNDGVRTIELRNGEATITEDILNNVARVVFSIYGDIKGAIARGTIRPMLYQDGDGTWEPYTGGKPSPSMEYKQDPESSGDSGEIGINMHGYNLFDASKIQTKSAGGATVTNNGDGSFTISGSGKLSAEHYFYADITHAEAVKLFKAGKISLNNNGKTYPKINFSFRTDQEKTTLGDSKNETETMLTEELVGDPLFYVRVFFYGKSGDTITPGTIKPMLYQDGDGTWEPFQLLRSTQFSTPNGLLGLPVGSGGNYTDSNGQQWICDELDFKRGKYVQRIKKLVFDGSEDEVWRRESSYVYILIKDSAPLTIPLVNKFLGVKNTNSNANTNNFSTISSSSALTCCLNGITDGELQVWTTYLQTNPIEVLYILSTPIETDIPEETMNAYRKLYTNYPSTVIQNDSGAGMEVEYVADTKQFILDQIKVLVQA